MAIRWLCIARHVRFAHSGSENSLMAYMWYQGHTFKSRRFTFNILDRVGGGSAFARGVRFRSKCRRSFWEYCKRRITNDGSGSLWDPGPSFCNIPLQCP